MCGLLNVTKAFSLQENSQNGFLGNGNGQNYVECGKIGIGEISTFCFFGGGLDFFF